MRFIDFEYGDFGNAFIDAAYLRMFMPSCWCSKRFPDEIISKMELIYRDELKKKIVSVSEELIYKNQLTYACAYWMLRGLQVLDEMNLVEREWIGSGGPVDADSAWDPKTNASRPRVLSRLEAFISLTKTTGHFPHLTMAFIALLEQLKKLWPETSGMELYPVFQGKMFESDMII